MQRKKMTKKQNRAILELIGGLILGMPSFPEIFNKAFIEMWNAGNKFAVIGIFTSALVGTILFLDSIAITCGFKNLGDLLERFN